MYLLLFVYLWSCNYFYYLLIDLVMVLVAHCNCLLCFGFVIFGCCMVGVVIVVGLLVGRVGHVGLCFGLLGYLVE